MALTVAYQYFLDEQVQQPRHRGEEEICLRTFPQCISVYLKLLFLFFSPSLPPLTAAIVLFTDEERLDSSTDETEVENFVELRRGQTNATLFIVAVTVHGE